jgi:hypothetical protein
LYSSDIEVLVKEIPPSLQEDHRVADFIRAKYSFLPEKLVKQLADEYAIRQKRSE